MSKFFKIVYGYNEGDYIPIKGDELHKAYALKMSQDGDGYFENGMIRAKDIMRIVPDFHKHFGWNRGYKLTSEDYSQIASVESDYTKAMRLGQELGKYALEQRNDLLSLPASEAIRHLPETQQLISDEVKQLADKFKKV